MVPASSRGAAEAAPEDRDDDVDEDATSDALAADVSAKRRELDAWRAAVAREREARPVLNLFTMKQLFTLARCLDALQVPPPRASELPPRCARFHLDALQAPPVCEQAPTSMRSMWPQLQRLAKPLVAECFKNMSCDCGF